MINKSALLIAILAGAGCARSSETFTARNLQPQDQKLLAKQIRFGQDTLVQHPMPYGVQEGNVIVLYPDGDWRIEYRYDAATQNNPERILGVDAHVVQSPSSTQSATQEKIDLEREVTRHELIGLVAPFEAAPPGYVAVPTVTADGKPAGDVLMEPDSVDPTAVLPAK